MILFLIVISIVNIALGYGLAVYLAKGSAAMTPQQPAGAGSLDAGAFVDDAQGTGAADFQWPAAATSAAIGVAGIATLVKNQATHDSALHAERSIENPEAQIRTAAMEQDLLAGIEEFRNQLAQLKSKGGGVFQPPIAAP